MRLRTAAAVTVLITALAGSIAHAQQSLPCAPEPHESVGATAPELPSKDDGLLARTRRWIKRTQLIERLNGDVDGWYPRMGRMIRGSGLAIGPGLRMRPFGAPVLIDVSAALSTRGYKSADANVRWFQSAAGRVEAWTDYRFEDFPRERYFGLGVNSKLDQRTSYGLASHDVQVRGLVRVTPWLRVGANTGYRRVHPSAGSDRSLPSIEQLFTEAEAPGLLARPAYLHSTLSAEIDHRDNARSPAAGGVYRVALGFWNDRSSKQNDFTRVDVLLNHFVPLDEPKKHVISGRLGLVDTNAGGTSRVPFYLLPYVGGFETIRSFREFRFRDQRAMWLGIEYQLRPSRYVGFAVFADRGKVTHSGEPSGWNAFREGYGAGIRFGTARQRFGRVDVGFGGGEGMRVFVKLGPS
jgi:outer membrane protein assembly factor BamA